MSEKSKKIVIWSLVAAFVLIVAGTFFIPKKSQAPANNSAYSQTALENLAKCLTDKGVKFYGAFWCPHCQSQKALFGEAQKSLPYIECSSPDGKGQLQICTDANIDGYPTWVFPDGTRQSGEIQLSDLAQKSGCQL